MCLCVCACFFSFFLLKLVSNTALSCLIIIACDPALRSALAGGGGGGGGQEKEGEAATTSLEFEYLHGKSR